jgi:hypothetical protein
MAVQRQAVLMHALCSDKIHKMVKMVGLGETGGEVKGEIPFTFLIAAAMSMDDCMCCPALASSCFTATPCRAVTIAPAILLRANLASNLTGPATLFVPSDKVGHPSLISGLGGRCSSV